MTEADNISTTQQIASMLMLMAIDIVSSFVWKRLISFLYLKWTLRRGWQYNCWSVLVLSQLPRLEQSGVRVWMKYYLGWRREFHHCRWQSCFDSMSCKIFFSSLMTRQIFYIILWNNNFHPMFSQFHDINSIGKTNVKSNIELNWLLNTIILHIIHTYTY